MIRISGIRRNDFSPPAADLGRSLLIGAALLTSATLLTGPLAAQDREQGQRPQARESDKRESRRDARAFRRLRVSGDEVAKNVRKLTKELRWHKSLSSALASGRRQGKPVVWIQALGDLDGFL